ncbi:PREDICTED: LOW QUALITY PROTEIN: 3-oxoacyl-[acyl-carrier-protein] reductase FabG-like [Trachymyrmex cornetzi]|uniref:LOW QUALITY PROTEIN: 3-oxoacyl-[acyl-carrier-protein] reductase FabG-like n=1 Tax=Trachymyrmex cornetzi TaxID=471704 RepID=UPI00084F2115|nr:PREDICTED: LOW QUALITY PROTEIN: 3-oxoacyl-[acyl-carrier-protein] reductase FabG-like [Trachymyrmex cornetzi]
MSFTGKVVLITGASSGIGAETAIQLAQLGASLSITGRNKHNLDKVAEQCGQPKPFIITGDLANENDVKNIIDSTIKHYGKLDVLVNNAAIVEFGSIETPSLEQYDNTFNVNVRSVFQLTTLAVPHLIKTKGNIVNVSSVAGLRPQKNNLPYCMSKAALDQFTRCVALELHHDRCMSFAGKVVLITGASSGIGAETAIQLAQLGASLSITGRNKHNLEKVAEQCGQPKPFIITGDLANENDVKNIIDSTIKHYGKLDVLINNAGIVGFGNIETPSLEQYDNIMNVNVRSVFQLTALAVPHLTKTKGNIVNVSSVAGLRPLRNSLSYCMSKAALDQFTRCVALELASRQVRVNSVNPGAVETNILLNTGLSQEQIKIRYEQLKRMHALERNGDSSEIGKTIAFLASDDASFMTGVTLLVDGGLHIVPPGDVAIH